MIHLILAAVLLALSPTAFAHHEAWHSVGRPYNLGRLVVMPLSINQKKFVNPRAGCEQRDDCDLVGVDFRKEDYELPPDNRDDVTIRSTAFLAGIHTTTIEALEKYSIVQFIRGCMWLSESQVDGTTKSWFGVRRGGGHFGKPTLFVHPEWTIDTNEKSPTYHADGEHPDDRHYFLQWRNPVPKWIPNEQSNLFGESDITVPYGFITDLPGPATLRHSHQILRQDGITVNMLQRAKNSSLTFQTCVYKTSDVPEVVDATTPLDAFGKPIVCYEWSQSFVYDHQANKFTSPPAPHAQCLRPFTVDEQHVQDLL